MRNLVYIVLLSFAFLSKSQCQGEIIQGTILKTNDYQVTVYARPNVDVNNTNDFAFLVTVSIPETMGQPEPIATASSPLAGVAIAPQPVEIIDSRYVYAFSLTGSGMINWLANSENSIIVIDFEENGQTIGKTVRLDDYTANGGGTGNSALWYAELQAQDYTNYSSMFYGVNTMNNFNIGGNSSTEANAPLPITLRSFTAKKYGKEDALLQWTSSTEVNSSHYEIERSTDNHNWERIATVKAAGNSTSDINYEYIDTNLPLNRELTVFYYRLKMVDTDNIFEYSDVRKISFDIIDNTTVKLYPNPAHQSVSVSTLTSQVLDQNAKALIFDVNGKLILEREISENGINTIDISGIPADIYFMHINIGTEKYIEKLIVIK